MLDDVANPYFRARRTAVRLGYLRNVLGLALAVVVTCNIALVLGVSGPDLHPLQGVRLSLGLCVASAFAGTFLGLFLACIPVLRLPYLVKVPVAAMAGTVVVNAFVAVAQAAPVLLAVLAS